MTDKTIVKTFLNSKIDWTKYPSVKKYKTNREKSYFILYVTNSELNIDQLSASEISNILTKKFKITTSTQAVRSALNSRTGSEIDTCEREDGVIVYSLLPNAVSVLGIDPEKIDTNFKLNEIVIPFELFDKQKDYIKKCLVEVNGCYRDCYFTACSIMLRRLFETLIIEIYEKKHIEPKIKDKDGNYLKLNALIKKVINEKDIKLSSQSKNHLPKIKLFGDTGAHSRKIIIRKHDIDLYRDNIRLAAEEIVSELTN